MNLRLPQLLGRDACVFVVLAGLALSVGMLLNHLRQRPLPLRYSSKSERLDKAVEKVASEQSKPIAHPSAALVEVRQISLEEFRDSIDKEKPLVLDARPEIFHRLGHVPGALALPRDDFEIYYKKHRAVLEKDKNQSLLVYCQGNSCEDSEMVTNALRQLGYTRMAIFTGGWTDWTREGFPQERQ